MLALHLFGQLVHDQPVRGEKGLPERSLMIQLGYRLLKLAFSGRRILTGAERSFSGHFTGSLRSHYLTFTTTPHNQAALTCAACRTSRYAAPAPGGRHWPDARVRPGFLLRLAIAP